MYWLSENKIKVKKSNLVRLKRLMHFCLCIVKAKSINRDDRVSYLNLRNSYHGERCFIVGNGPSLNKLDLSKLKDEYTFVSNLIYKRDDFLNYEKCFYAIEDKVVYADNCEEINALSHYKYKFLPSDISLRKKGFLITPFMRISTATGDEKKFLTNRTIHWGGTVSYYLLQLAVWMGFKEIYFIGTDLDYVLPSDVISYKGALKTSSTDPNHFIEDYFGKDKLWNIPHAERMEEYLTFGAHEARARGVKVLNATAGGKFNAIQRVNFNELF